MKFLRLEQVENLATRVATLLQDSEADGLGKPYFPTAMLADLVKHDGAIKSVLDSPSQAVTESTIKFVKNNPRVFAITLLALQDTSSRKLALDIFAHPNFEFKDHCLPVENLQDRDICPEICNIKGRECDHVEEAISFHLGPWGLEQFKIFFDIQWSFCVPTFREDKFMYHFSDQMILPIARKAKRNAGDEEDEIIGAGSFGEVQYWNCLLSIRQPCIE